MYRFLTSRDSLMNSYQSGICLLFFTYKTLNKRMKMSLVFVCLSSLYFSLENIIRKQIVYLMY